MRRSRSFRKFHFCRDLVSGLKFLAYHRLDKTVYYLLYDRFAFDSLELNHKFLPSFFFINRFCYPVFCMNSVCETTLSPSRKQTLIC